jgi:hypothetical protein
MADHVITLDDYELANLQALFEALNGSRLDTGDWCGQMRWKLGDLKADCGPNTDAKGMLDLLSGFGGGF